MKKQKQLELIPLKTNRRFFGGVLLHGRRKSQRPLSNKDAIHIVLRSPYAKGQTSLRNLEHLAKVESILDNTATKYGIRIYRKAIQSNHIHLIIKVHNRWLYRCFISVISGKIASLVMKGMSFKNFLKSLPISVMDEGYAKPYQGQAFWEYRPFSRILYWGKDFKKCCDYLRKNILEAFGFISYDRSLKQKSRYTKYLVKMEPSQLS